MDKPSGQEPCRPSPGADEEPSRPLEEQLPPEIVASPREVQSGQDETIMWWRPRWEDILAQVGWRWVFLAPAAILLVLGAVCLFRPGFGGLFLIVGFKLVAFVVAVAASMACYLIRRIARARSEAFCIHCGYNLTGLPDNYRCPECGRPYTWRLIAEYRRDPQWFIERWHAQHHLPPPAVPFAAGKAGRRRSRDGTA